MRLINPSFAFGRITLLVIALMISIAIVLYAQRTTVTEFASKHAHWPVTGSTPTVDVSVEGISYDLTTPPSTGCESLVNDLQQTIIRSYADLFKGVRYANVWGYLETENKGDAAIWSAQQILMSMLGIETMEVCRYVTECRRQAVRGLTVADSSTRSATLTSSPPPSRSTSRTPPS